MAETAASPACFYRPRRVRDSPLYRLAEEHLETFKQVYDDCFASRFGSWRSEIERTLLAFLDCGLPERGFARIRCPSCRHEFLLAFSCKARGFCMSCHAKRAALWAEHLAEHVLLPVPHDQWVFTLPKRLRLFFLYDRTLLGDLARCAWGTVRDLYLAGRPDRTAVSGLVASVQTYGDLANWQPPIHALVTQSRNKAHVWAPKGGCVPGKSLSRRSPPPRAQLFVEASLHLRPSVLSSPQVRSGPPPCPCQGRQPRFRLALQG